MDGQQRNRLVVAASSAASPRSSASMTWSRCRTSRDARERKVALEPAGQLKDLAQVEQRTRAAVPLRAQLRPAQIPALLQEAVQDVGHGERVAEPGQPVGELDEPDTPARDLWVHLGEAFSP